MDNRENEESIYLSIIINHQTVSVMRNQDEKIFMVNITDNEDFVNTTFNLQANTAEGNPRSTKFIDTVESFFYAFYPYGDVTEIEALFTKMDDTQFTLRLHNATILNEPFKSVELTNKDLANTAVVKVIYS